MYYVQPPRTVGPGSDTIQFSDFVAQSLNTTASNKIKCEWTMLKVAKRTGV